MTSFLIFYHEKPIEIQCTPLIAGEEKRYVIKAGEVGAVIKQHCNKWIIVGAKSIDHSLLELIGNRISEIDQSNT